MGLVGSSLGHLLNAVIRGTQRGFRTKGWSADRGPLTPHEASPFLRERDDLYCPDSLLSVIPLNRIIEMGPPSSFEGCENPSMHFAVNIVVANIGRIV